MSKGVKEDAYANPWKTLGTRIVYDNPWISVREDDVEQPDGRPGIYGVVHFKNLAIGVLPIDEHENTYLVGQWRYALNQYSWEIPEGGGPYGEEPIDTAKRELLEETGLTAGKWHLLGQGHLSNSATDEVTYYYLATELTQGEAQPDSIEKLECKRVPFEEALRMVLEGEITDGLSVLAILSYATQKQMGRI